MNITKKSVRVKGYNKKHLFEVETSEMCGYTFITVKKNGNPILKCTPKDYIKFKQLFTD